MFYDLYSQSIDNNNLFDARQKIHHLKGNEKLKHKNPAWLDLNAGRFSLKPMIFETLGLTKFLMGRKHHLSRNIYLLLL